MRIETLAGQLNHVVLEDVRGAFVGVWGGKGGAGGSREVGVFTGGKTSVPNTAGATASSAHNQGSPHGGGRYMAWALLCAQREGYAAEALDTWRALVEGRVEERGVGTAQHGVWYMQLVCIYATCECLLLVSVCYLCMRVFM